MSKYINEILKLDPSKTEIEVNVDPIHLKLITDYCAKFDYIKVRSTLEFPAAHNELSKNVALCEYLAIKSIQYDLNELKKLLGYCKKL